MKILETLLAVSFIVIALVAMLAGGFAFFEGFVGILLGNILLAIRESDA